MGEKKERTPSKRVRMLIKQALSLAASFPLSALTFRDSELTEHWFALSLSQAVISSETSR